MVIFQELQEKKYKLESNHREMRSRISSQEEELQHLKQEVQALRKQNSAMDADLHEQEKIINQQRTRIAVLEQEVKDKEQVLARSSDLLDSEQDQKVSIFQKCLVFLSHCTPCHVHDAH